MWNQLKVIQHKEVVLGIDKGIHHPIHIEVEPTEVCNHACVFCHWHAVDKQGKLPNFEFKGGRYIPLERMLDLVSELDSEGVKAISFTGAGDPMMYKHMQPTLQKILETDMVFGMTTNLNMKLSDELIELVGRAEWVRLSINAGPNTYKDVHSIRGPRGWDETMANLEKLVAAPGRTAKLNISYVVCDDNSSDVYAAAENAKKMGVDTISFRPEVTGFERDSEKMQYPQSVIDQFKKMDDLESDDFMIYRNFGRLDENVRPSRELNCYWSNHSVYIAANMDVYPCCMTRFDEGYSIDNISEKSFNDFWHSEKRRKNYKGIDMQFCPPCHHGDDNFALEILYGEKQPDKFI